MSGIRDKVAILGMGCSKFGERWDAEPSDLMVEAFVEALADAGIEKNQIEAAWLSTAVGEMNIGPSGLPLAIALRLPFIPITRVENFCASGSDALRNAAYAVASGACDFALALGVEKLKDTGYGGLPQRVRGTTNDMYLANASAPGVFAQLASAYQATFGVDRADIKNAMAHVSVKSHRNGMLNPKAHLHREITVEDVLGAPFIADPIGLYDCCGVSDGAACAIVTTPEIARSLGRKNPVTIKAIQMAVSNGSEAGFNDWDGSYLKTTRIASERAYKEAGISSPRDELSMIEVHDCFSITEVVTMEDLHISAPGQAPTDIMNGFYDADGKIPCQIDGGLKTFGHPIGASGLRMVYEMYLQLNGRADKRQLGDPKLGLTHNLGGLPSQNVAAVCIVGLQDA
jgi:acetyl-CoA C-acetyltransferase